MPNVRADHEEIVVADPGHAVVSRSAMDRAILTDHVVVADLNTAPCVRVKSEILRRRSDHSSVTDHVARSNCDASFENDMRLNATAISEPNIAADHAVWADFQIAAKRRFG